MSINFNSVCVVLKLHQIASSKDFRWISIIEFARYFNKVNFDREHVSIKIKFDFQLYLLLVSETVKKVSCFENNMWSYPKNSKFFTTLCYTEEDLSTRAGEELPKWAVQACCNNSKHCSTI